MARTLTLAFLLITLTACEGAEKLSVPSGTDAADEVAPPPPAPAAPAMMDGAVAGQAEEATPPARRARAAAPAQTIGSFPGIGAAGDAMLIRTGTARIGVDSLEIALEQLRRLATQLGGYITNTSVHGGGDVVREAMLELKVPGARFDNAVSALEPIGDLESVNVQAQDVGEEYVDVAARVENARRLEERYLRLLETRTGSLSDVLAVERELARVREEIERLQGRLHYLESRVAMSTLTVLLHEPFPLIGSRPGSNVIADAARQGWRNFVGFIAGFISLLGFLLPLGLLAAAGWWTVRWVRRARPIRWPHSEAPSQP